MNRKEAAELLPIIKAYVEGETIQSRCIKGDKSLWYDDEDPSFDDDFEYRIKPESKYRPFANTEECWTEMLKHQPFGWVKDKDDGHYVLITLINDEEYGISINGKPKWSLSGLMRNFIFADGVPFGVKVEE